MRHIRLALGRPATRQRAAPQHRSRRPRKPALGQLAQLDASPYAWFEDRGPLATLHGVIDDATSTPLALCFRPHEDLHGYVTILDRTCRQYGVPLELFGDRLNIFVRNDTHWTLAEEVQGHQDPTHFGRMLQALGIGFIRAHSPQAKGRIERLWDTLQDRLTSELRLRGISTLEAGNAFLPEFLADFTPRFARPPAEPTPAWRPAPRDLADLLSCRYPRTVARDNTVHLGPRWVQIPPGPGGAPMPAVGSTSANASMASCACCTTTRCSPVSPRPTPPSCCSRAKGPGRRAAGPALAPCVTRFEALGALSSRHCARCPQPRRARLSRPLTPAPPSLASRRPSPSSQCAHASLERDLFPSPTRSDRRTHHRGGHFYLTVGRTFSLTSDIRQSAYRPARPPTA